MSEQPEKVTQSEVEQYQPPVPHEKLLDQQSISRVPSGAITSDTITAGTIVSGAQFNFNVIDEESSSRIAQQITSGRPGATSKPPPFVLPPHAIDFFTGREAELQQLENLLFNSDGPRIVGIVATGGMGKSALAIHFAKTHRTRFRDGVIGLRVDNEHINTLARRFALAYADGKEIDSGRELSAAQIMQSTFQQKQALLIFDNVEEAMARDLNPDTSECAVIVTTRNRGLLREFGIPPAAQIDLPGFAYDQTRDFLSRMLGEQLVSAEAEAARAIHGLVGGLPLALRIVGGVLQDQSFITTLAEYASMLRREKERLLSHLKDSDVSDLNVRASFEISLKFLNEAQKTLFACLGACAREGFTRQIARVVSDQNEDDVREGLGRLFRLSLINWSKETSKFVLHPLLFLFARELGQEHNWLTAAARRHTDYFVRFARDHRSLSALNMDALEKELDALLLTAMRLFGNLTAANAFYLSLEPFLQARGFWFEALELLDGLLRVARDSHDYYQTAQALLQQAQFLQLLSRFDDTERALQESKNAALRIENPKLHQHMLGMVLNSLGVLYQRQGKPGQAADYFQQSYDLRIESDEKLGQAMSLHSLGVAYHKQGEFDLAIKAFQQSYDLLVTLSQEPDSATRAQHEQVMTAKYGLAKVLNSWGRTYLQQDRYDLAIKDFQQSYDLRVELGEDLGQAMVLTSLGDAYLQQGQLPLAVEKFQQSLEIEKKIGNQRGEAMVWNSLGGVYQRQGQLDLAVEAFQQSLILGEKLNLVKHQAMVLLAWGQALLGHKQPEQAVEKLKASFEIDESLKSTRGMGMITPALVRALTAIDQQGEALAYCRRALSIAPDDRRLLRLQEQLVQERPMGSQRTVKTGYIRRIRRNSQTGYLYGFITPDDESEDIYFGEDRVDSLLLPKLAEGQSISVEVEKTSRGLRARRVW